MRPILPLTLLLLALVAGAGCAGPEPADAQPEGPDPGSASAPAPPAETGDAPQAPAAEAEPAEDAVLLESTAEYDLQRPIPDATFQVGRGPGLGPGTLLVQARLLATASCSLLRAPELTTAPALVLTAPDGSVTSHPLSSVAACHPPGSPPELYAYGFQLAAAEGGWTVAAPGLGTGVALHVLVTAQAAA